jgi:tetratricopeptide (TPR) repeat protein
MGAEMFRAHRVLLTLSLTALLLSPARILAQAQPAAAGAEKQPEFKNQAEYDLYTAITQDTNPKTRMEKLQQWEKQFPDTAWIKARRTLFLTTYVALDKPKEAVEAAKAILATDPKDFTAQYYILFYVPRLYAANASREVLDQGEKAASSILASITTPPPNVKDEDWAKLRPAIELMAHVNSGFFAWQRKNWGTAEAEFQKSLQLNGDNGQVDFWLAVVLSSQKKPELIPAALFYYARAGTFEGTGAADPAVRKQALDFAKRQYKSYHGSDEGFNEVLIAQAKANAIMPADFATKIRSATDINNEQALKEEEAAKANPQLALWKQLKGTLISPDGANYFNSSMKDALIPTLKGKVVSIEPAVKPKTVVMALEDGTTPDVTLKFDTSLPGKVEPGTELSFEGVPQSYTATPFMVVFNVDKDKLHGWTGKNAPAAPHHRALTSKR